MSDQKISQLTASTTPLAGTEVLPIVQGVSTVKVAVSNLTAGRPISASGYTVEYNTGLYTSDATISNYSASNGVYLNGNAAGWLNLSGDGARKQTIVLYGGTSNDIVISTGAIERLRIIDAASGNVSLATGNLVIGTAGKGIDFSASSHAGGMTSELLSDYEEGTWTPVLTTSTPPTTPFDLTGTNGTYTKVGRQVTVRAYIGTQNVNIAGAAGALRITGLPFNISGFASCSFALVRNWGLNAPRTAYFEDGTSYMVLETLVTANGGGVGMSATDLVAGATADRNVAVFSATYFV